MFDAQLEQVDYPTNPGSYQYASASNNYIGAASVILAFPPGEINTVAQNILTAYGNYSSNVATNPNYGFDSTSLSVCNTTTYNALLAGGMTLGQANNVMQDLANASNLNLFGANFDINILGSMLNSDNNVPDDADGLESDSLVTMNPNGQLVQNGTTLGVVAYTNYTYNASTGQYIDPATGQVVAASTVDAEQQTNLETAQQFQNLTSEDDPYSWIDPE